MLSTGDLPQRQELLVGRRGNKEIYIMPVLGEADLLREMFIHLLSNAAAFNPGAGRIIVGAADDGRYIVVSVSDTGSGIPAEGWPCVFEAFYQGAHPHAVKADDSTLGLVTARKIIAAHGGTMAIQNGPGPGATFILSEAPCRAPR